ncbi:PAS domain-containing sensor histidine kinase [Tautonia plasticadhaerens]|uniref:Oxygen sensor histidine kinase NreB n=1 Tax=Tautonia plasticadhaerens TaxID=2527974 RepID=A0A518GZ99_9BACT|nr:PAS domain S-box protein [Tautonia plasticadhaerens]QDV33927.1 Oxygen sensor histidine kinase NreB [Tautonia plasticadhaerens]
MIHAPIPVILLAEDGEILLVNRAWTELTGYGVEELRTLADWTDRAYGERSGEYQRHITTLFDLGRNPPEPDARVRIRDGSERIWSFSSAALGRLPDGRRLLMRMALDVTDRRRAEDELRVSEERFRALADSAPDGIFIHARRRFSYVNPMASGLFGAGDPGELIGTPILDRFRPEDREAMVELSRRAVDEGRPVGLRELTILRPGGGTLEVEPSAAPFPLDGDDAGLVFVRDIRDRRRVEQALETTTARLRELNRHVLEVQEAERRHLSRELHDEIGQTLTAIKLDVQSARLRPETREERLEDAVALLDGALGQVRDLALDLRPSILDDLGLVPALGWYVERFRARSGIEGEFSCEPPEIRVDPSVATACFRGVQEALTNVGRHSGAGRFSVALRGHPEGLELEVRDDGEGFDPGRLPPRRGLGLVGMRERVEQAGGRLEVASSPGSGTGVRLSFPPRGASDGRGAAS